MTDETKAREGEDVCAVCKGLRDDLARGREPEELCDPCYDDAISALSSATPAEDVVERQMNALMNAYVAGATDARRGYHYVRNPDFTDAAYDHASAALSIQPPPDVAQLQAEIERLRDHVADVEKAVLTCRERRLAAEAKLVVVMEALERIAATDDRLGLAVGAPAECAEIARATLASIKETSNG